MRRSAPLALAMVEMVVIVKKQRAGPEREHKPVALFGSVDRIGLEKSRFNKRGEVRSQLIVENARFVLQHFQAAEPLGTNSVIAFLQDEARVILAIVQIGEMKEQAQVERLSDGGEALHQLVIEAGEMLLLERFDDGLGQAHRAGFDGIACELSALENDLRKDREGVLDKAAVGFFEIGGHEGAMDLVERAIVVRCNGRPSSFVR